MRSLAIIVLPTTRHVAFTHFLFFSPLTFFDNDPLCQSPTPPPHLYLSHTHKKYTEKSCIIGLFVLLEKQEQKKNEKPFICINSTRVTSILLLSAGVFLGKNKWGGRKQKEKQKQKNVHI